MIFVNNEENSSTYLSDFAYKNNFWNNIKSFEVLIFYLLLFFDFYNKIKILYSIKNKNNNNF